MDMNNIFVGNGVMGSGEGSAIKPGIYQGQFVGVEAVASDASKNDYGPGVKWLFKTTNATPDTPAGTTISRITGQKPTPNNACGKMFVGLAGAIAKGAPLPDIAQFVGKRFNLIVQPTEKGSRLESVMPA